MRELDSHFHCIPPQLTHKSRTPLIIHKPQHNAELSREDTLSNQAELQLSEEPHEEINKQTSLKKKEKNNNNQKTPFY